MEIQTHKDEATLSDIYKVRVHREDTQSMVEPIQIRVMELVAQQLAKDILENNYAEIMAKISPEAIANMSIAEAGAKIHEMLNKEVSGKTKIIEKNTTQVYQKGLFGGLKRIG